MFYFILTRNHIFIVIDKPFRRNRYLLILAVGNHNILLLSIQIRWYIVKSTDTFFEGTKIDIFGRVMVIKLIFKCYWKRTTILAWNASVTHTLRAGMDRLDAGVQPTMLNNIMFSMQNNIAIAEWFSDVRGGKKKRRRRVVNLSRGWNNGLFI